MRFISESAIAAKLPMQLSNPTAQVQNLRQQEAECGTDEQPAQVFLNRCRDDRACNRKHP